MGRNKLTLLLAGLALGGALPFAVAKVAAAPVPRPLLQQALETAQDVTGPRERLFTLFRIASVQNETGDAAGALKTCRAAREIARGLPDDLSKVQLLTTIAADQAEAGDRAAAAETLKLTKQTADAIKDARQKGNALVQLAAFQGLFGDYEGALRTAKAGGDYQGSALQIFAWSLRKPDKPAARKALREAVAMLKSLPKNKQRQYLPQLAKAQVWVDDLPGALQTIDLLDADWKKVGQEAIAVAQARAGDVAGALKTLKAMEGAPPGGRGPVPDQLRGWVLQAIARAQAKAGDRAGAEATLKLLRPIVDDLYVLEARLAERLPRRGMSGFSQAADLEGTIALTQYQIGDVAGARQTARAVKPEYGKARAMLNVGEAAAGAGKRAEARDFLRAAAKAAENTQPGSGQSDAPSESRKNMVLWNIAQQQAKVGDVREALRTAESISAGQERDLTLGAIAAAQAEAGDGKGALQTLARIKESARQADALAGLVEGLVKAGDERGAVAVVSQQTSPARKVRALLGLAKGRAKGKADKDKPAR
jgi:hypothetical protein